MAVAQRHLLGEARAHHVSLKDEACNRFAALPLFVEESPPGICRPAMTRRLLDIARAEWSAEKVAGEKFEARRNVAIIDDRFVLDPGRSVEGVEAAVGAVDRERADMADGEIEGERDPFGRNASETLVHFIPPSVLRAAARIRFPKIHTAWR
jgi:hypothetical protein